MSEQPLLVNSVNGVSPGDLFVNDDEVIEDETEELPGIEIEEDEEERVNGDQERVRGRVKGKKELVEIKPSDAEWEDAVPVKIPELPTKAEKDHHCLTHGQYRSWCGICVKAWGQEDPRRKVKTRKILGYL